MTTFWTMGADNEFPAVTLCEEHALEATNIAGTLCGMGPWTTMEEAALEIETLTAVFGQGQPGVSFTTSEEGHCDECAHPTLTVVVVEEESA